jgi:hypothetical protein
VIIRVGALVTGYDVLTVVLNFDVPWNLSKLHFNTSKSAMASSVPLSVFRRKWQGSSCHHLKVNTGSESGRPFPRTAGAV